MNYLGIDFGTKRIGLSFADEVGVPYPLEPAVQATQAERLDHIAHIIETRKPNAIVIGYPLHMSGEISEKAREVDAFCTLLQKRFELPIHRCDERLSSHQAHSDNLQHRPKKKFNLSKHRKERAKGTLDSQAATIILRDFLADQGLFY